MPAAGATKTVLIADDTAFVRDRFQAAIASAGHRAITATTEADVLTAVGDQRTPLDLLLIDLRLPDGTGTSLVRSVRALNEDVPILVFGGAVTGPDEVGVLAALGIAGYISEYCAVQHILPVLAPQLFPDEYDRRDGPRLVLGIPVSYRVGSTIAAALMLNLSRSGTAVRTTSPLALATPARLRFKLPGSEREIEVASTVCWSDKGSGMGLLFDHIESADQTVVNAFVDAHASHSRKP